MGWKRLWVKLLVEDNLGLLLNDIEDCPGALEMVKANIPTQIVPHAYDSAFASLQFQYPWPLAFEGFPEDRAASASKSHSQAEKRRRDRINAQLATLRKLIPKSDKMDKAALLGSVVDHVKDLKRKAMDVSKSITVPSETDEVTIIECDPDQDERLC
ncbi:hypothetical protein HN51_058053 [Arachis hypogaea]